MIPGKISKRYAKALLELCDEERNHTKVRAELDSFHKAYAQSSELRYTLQNPSVTLANKRSLVDQLCQKLAIGRFARNFVCFLLDRGRIDYLESILAQFQQSIDARAGHIRAYVTSAVALGPDEVERIRKALARKPGVTQVAIETKVDPSLLGGVITRVGNTVFDGSVRNRLASMREHLSLAN